MNPQARAPKGARAFCWASRQPRPARQRNDPLESSSKDKTTRQAKSPRGKIITAGNLSPSKPPSRLHRLALFEKPKGQCTSGRSQRLHSSRAGGPAPCPRGWVRARLGQTGRHSGCGGGGAERSSPPPRPARRATQGSERRFDAARLGEGSFAWGPGSHVSKPVPTTTICG